MRSLVPHPIERHSIEFNHIFLESTVMFVTHNQFRSPLSKLSAHADEQLWSSVSLVFQMQWVMLTIRFSQVDEDGDQTVTYKTLLLSNFSTVVGQIFFGKKGDAAEFVSAYIFMPADTQESNVFDWTMEPVAKIWLAESDDDPGATFEVCETKSGKRHIVTRFVDQNISLKNLKLICEF